MDWFMGKARRKDKEPNPSSNEETKQYLHGAMLECSSSEARLREIVDIAEGLDYNEWLASHTIAFFDHINLIYGTISEFCTPSFCPDMSGPCNRQYLWVDEKGKRSKLPAPQYVDLVMTFAQKAINDQSIFPTKFDKDFPVNLESTVKKIMKLLYHVLAHIYHSHFREIVLLNLHPHLNCIFAHLVLFNERFHLIEDKELEVLNDLAVALKLFPPEKCDPNSGNGNGGEISPDAYHHTIQHQNHSHHQQPSTVGLSTGTIVCGGTSPMLIEDNDDNRNTINLLPVTTQPLSNDANNNLGIGVMLIRSELDDEMKENIVSITSNNNNGQSNVGKRFNTATNAINPSTQQLIGHQLPGSVTVSGTVTSPNHNHHHNHHHHHHHHASPIKTIDLNAGTNNVTSYAPSPMLVDDPIVLANIGTVHGTNNNNKFPTSPEPMMVETSDNLTDGDSLQDDSNLRGRSISANAVLGAYDSFGTQSPIARRCNSDRNTKTVK